MGLDLGASVDAHRATTQPQHHRLCDGVGAQQGGLYLFGGGGTRGILRDTYCFGAGAWTRLETKQ
ncbi:MAG: hypothetical protein M5U28_07590 [Sandaracinaceae bacterium]|nr:hypothetical protein [Sandaracinaceae bacterium]